MFIEAIRSVTHLVLALDRKSSSVFSFYSKASSSWSFFRLTERPTRCASPENVQYRSVFIQFEIFLVRRHLSPGASVQPACDSRHGRIACKTFREQFHYLLRSRS